MAKQLGKDDRDQNGRIKLTSYRLETEVLDDLDAIAAHYTESVGTQITRTGAIRIAARNERKRIEGEKTVK